MKQLLILASVLLLGSYSLVAYCKSLAALIARMNFEKALICIRGQQWQLLINNIKLSSYKWRFAGRPYILIVGLFARVKLKSHEVNEWTDVVDRDVLLKQHYDNLKLVNDVQLEEYLTNQIQNDVILLPVSNSIVMVISASIGLTVAVVLYIFGS